MDRGKRRRIDKNYEQFFNQQQVFALNNFLDPAGIGFNLMVCFKEASFDLESAFATKKLMLLSIPSPVTALTAKN